MAFSVGEFVGDYEVIEVLGAGGMGTVYKVRHSISDRLEAMKVVLPELAEDPELAERFTREIKIQAHLSHPNIASLHYAFRAGSQLLMVMELAEGQTLHKMLHQGFLRPKEGVDLAMQVLAALQYAHGQGVVHRDVKPANIMISASGQIKLMDFGIARLAKDHRQLTKAGAAVGSLYYMSPEQVQGMPVDGRSDIYSLGVVLYEAVTGIRPISGDSSWAIMNAHLNFVPSAPSSVNVELPELLSLAILKAIEKNPDERFQTAKAFAQSLNAIQARLGIPAKTWQSLPETQLASPQPLPTVPPAPKTTPPSGSLPAVAPVQFDPERLEQLKRELALYIGPVSKMLVSRAVKKAQNWRQLYDALAPEIPEGEERKRFLSKRP